VYFRKQAFDGRAYLQIFESHREGDQVRQQVSRRARARGRTADERPIGAAVALGRAVCRQDPDAQRRDT